MPEIIDVEVTPVGPCDAPPTVTILIQRTPRGWLCKCCPPEGMALGDMTARGATLSGALGALVEMVEEWEEERDEEDDYDDGAEFDDEDE